MGKHETTIYYAQLWLLGPAPPPKGAESSKNFEKGGGSVVWSLTGNISFMRFLIVKCLVPEFLRCGVKLRGHKDHFSFRCGGREMGVP